MLRYLAVVYFMPILWITINCQAVDKYTLQKISWESRPNEQPLLLLGRKQSHPAVPQFLDNMPQIVYKMNEEVMLSCPETSTPGEVLRPPVVASLETAENNSGPAAPSGEHQIEHTNMIGTTGRIDSTTANPETSHSNLAPILESENQSATTGAISDKLGTVPSTSTFDSLPSSTGASLPRVSELETVADQRKRRLEESNQPDVVQETVTKKKAKFYAADIRFPWELPHLKCERPAQATARKVDRNTKDKAKMCEIESCKDNGEVYEIGFWVKGHKSLFSTVKNAFSSRKKRQSPKKPYEWHPFIIVCFNMHELRPVYAKYTLHGSAIKAAAILMQRPNYFDYEELFQPYDQVDPSSFYDKEIQYKLFESMLGSDIAYTYNDTVSKFLIPLQLVAPAEMPTPVSTLTTYSYLNTTPSWETVALRNWRILTQIVLSYAEEKQDELVVYSGTANILQLLSEAGELENIRLHFRGKTLAVAKILYKLLLDQRTNEAIIFFVSNNPYVGDSSDQVCADVCDSSGWGNEFWKNLDRGYTTCCDYEKVKNAYSSLPQIKVDNLGLLRNRQARTGSSLSEINETDLPVNSESAFAETSEVTDAASASTLVFKTQSGEEITTF